MREGRFRHIFVNKSERGPLF